MVTHRPLRLLMLGHNTEGMGSYYRYSQFARALAQLGHDVTLMVGPRSFSLRARSEGLGRATQLVTPGVVGRRLRNGGLGPVETAYRVRHVLRTKYDVVHASEHRPVGSVPALIARSTRDALYVSDWSDLWGKGGIVDERRWPIRQLLTGPETHFEKAALRAADAVTVISSGLLERATSLGVPPDRVLSIPDGADVESVRPLPKRETRERLGLPVDAKLLVYAGQAPYDMQLLWESFEEVVQRYKKDVYLLVLGRMWPETERFGSLRRRIIQLGWQPYPTFTQYLPCGDVMLLPYRNRSVNVGRWPGKLGLYLASGRPIVTNPTGDVETLFKEEQVGLLAEESPHDFADAIIQLLEDEALAQKLGQHARRVAESRFAWPILAERLSGFYAKLLAAQVVSP